MAGFTLGETEFRDKVYACWLGKNIGGTIGAPFEGKKYVNDLDFYRPVPTEPAPNDDLDLQLVWLKMLEDKGAAFGLPDFAHYWRSYLPAYPWNEYGFCMRNLERGLLPPVSGWFENYYVDEMGSPIRSEIWACIAPANPQHAAALAWMDSAMDHAGGEGTYGEMFWAAVESAAFVLSDPYELIRLGLDMIPPACSISRVIREAVWCRQNGKSWAEARERIVITFGHSQPCNAIANHGFIILGWLYGEGFGDSLCKAVNCGYDTDCTGATLGAVLGILGGTAGIPPRWSEPVGKAIVLHPYTGHFNAPATLDELTDRCVALATRFAAERPYGVDFGARTALPDDARTQLFRTQEAAAALVQDVRAAVARERDLEIALHYGGGPVLHPGIGRRIWVDCRRGGLRVECAVSLGVPAGWAVRALGAGAFEVVADAVADSNTITMSVEFGGTSYSAAFTVLGPGAAKGFPCAANIEKCPVCHGRLGSCICEQA